MVNEELGLRDGERIPCQFQSLRPLPVAKSQAFSDTVSSLLLSLCEPYKWQSPIWQNVNSFCQGRLARITSAMAVNTPENHDPEPFGSSYCSTLWRTCS